MKVIANISLTTSAGELKKYIDNFSNDIMKMQSLIDYIPNCWRGKDATSFIKKFNEEIFPELQKYKKSFNEYQTYLSKVYSVFERLEEDYNKKIV